MNHRKINFQPRVTGFLCKAGAYAFYDISNPARLRLPANFLGLAVASISQVQMREVLKAFLSGAEGVLLAACEHCRNRRSRGEIEQQFAGMQRALAGFGIDADRVILEWISAGEEEKFFRTVDAMMEALRRRPRLRLPPGLEKNVVHCG